MKARANILVGIVSGILACSAHAGGAAPDERPLESLKDGKLVAEWRVAAWEGDARKQERLAELLLDPRARVKKTERLEGAHLLLRAAFSGRNKSMLQLAAALRRGDHGFKQLPAASACWSGMPVGFDARLACLRLTDVRDPRTRIHCDELGVMREGLPPGGRSASAMARICLANRTPALMVAGPPPGKEDSERWRLYARHGIEWQITGDVFDEKFEQFRDEFNRTTVEGIEAERGQGYMKKLSEDIEAKIATWRERGK